MRAVPADIARPDYADTGTPGQAWTSPWSRAAEVIERMRVAGSDRGRGAGVTGAAVRPGDHHRRARRHLPRRPTIERGAYPSTLNYHGYPKSLCTSVNEVICHGIPDSRPLADGDIVNLDVTVYLDGVHGDTNATFRVGDVDDESRRLVDGDPGVPRPRHRRGRAGPPDHRHRPGHPAPRRGRTASAWSAAFVRPRHRRGRSTPARSIPHYYEPAAATDHGARHDLHHRADDHPRHAGGSGCGTTAGPRSPPTVGAPRSSSTPCW